jgi:hypothetical protein
MPDKRRMRVSVPAISSSMRAYLLFGWSRLPSQGASGRGENSANARLTNVL